MGIASYACGDISTCASASNLEKKQAYFSSTLQLLHAGGFFGL